ncbi:MULTISPECIES: TonB-dependent vitamin B12 receptor [unclassified Uliginosibacterium]|uniref:TonB-dependent vitamin B12 receptor n=1 Tax=unclassified Uliginosibacterium TaxID=2621521 RepID=UPI000C7971E7|nr:MULTISPECIES: TonB-dependent vitamin B12 receptor [unclassified Uliginosibacterium]MDO6387140.1 TonB-dependent vitamin B12 receptor [Uliginosibacterium sp. 31-12]PLK50838.1 TonB-dependent vitamin B12 receptor [Uliginosibacterium sp. TH139]
MNFTHKTLPAALLLALSHPVLAQETELAPVVITANRVARSAEETLTSVSVITRKEIEQQQARSVPDLLRGLPGVQFANNGGPGKTTSLFLRGTNSDHTLVLIDGVKVGSATSGGTALQDLPIEQIERIELVRGPRASLYGSEAIGGVIQIFTKKGVQPTSLSLTGGSRHSFEGSAAGGFGSPDAWLNLGASGLTTRGINVKDGGSAPESDRDGYTRSTVNVRGGGRIGENLSYDAQALHTEGRNEYDGNPNVTDLQQDLYAGNLRWAASERYTTSFKLAQTLDASKNFKDDKFSSRFDTRRSQASWQNDFTLAEGHQLVGGYDYLYDEALSSTSYALDSRVNQAVFGQYLADIGRFDLQVAGRHDKNEQYGHHNTGSLALGYTFTPALRLRASYGTAFKAPSFNDLYYPGAGNPDLQPEKSRSSELGASGKTGGFSWEASLFRTEVSNLIAWAPISTGSAIWIPSNVSKARITGLELGAKQHFGNTTLAASATLQNPQDQSGSSTDGNLLVRRARQFGRLDADHQLGAWSIGASLNGVGSRYDDAANKVKLGGYATTDLRAEYALNKDWRAQTRLENVFDKNYQTAYGYNQAGTSAWLTLRYQPK